MIFNSVVGSTVEETGYSSPLVTEAGMGPDYGIVFFGRESPMLDLRGKLIAPPEPAGFTRPTRDGLADK